MVKVKCKHCNYEWEYKGIGRFAACPRCHLTNELMGKDEFIKKLKGEKNDKQ